MHLVHEVADSAGASGIGVEARTSANVGDRAAVVGREQARACRDEGEVQFDVALRIQPSESLLEAEHVFSFRSSADDGKNAQCGLSAGATGGVRKGKLRDYNLSAGEERTCLLYVALEIRVASTIPMLWGVSICREERKHGDSSGTTRSGIDVKG